MARADGPQILGGRGSPARRALSRPDPQDRAAELRLCCARPGPHRWAPRSPRSPVRGRRGGGVGLRRPGKHGCSS